VPADEALRMVTIAEPSVGPSYRRLFVEAGFSSAGPGRSGRPVNRHR